MYHWNSFSCWETRFKQNSGLGQTIHGQIELIFAPECHHFSTTRHCYILLNFFQNGGIHTKDITQTFGNPHSQRDDLFDQVIEILGICHIFFCRLIFQKFFHLWNKIALCRYTLSSNRNIHKSLCGLCFWAPDPLIDRF